MPDAIPPLPMSDEEIERRLLERAIREADESTQPDIPHAVMRQRLLADIASQQANILKPIED